MPTRDPNPRFDSLLKSGIAAAKKGDRDKARRLLTSATELVFRDPRPWLWLSGTTDDPEEQRSYLEHVLAADPNNSAAKRGLLQLSGRLEGERVLAEGEQVAARQPTVPDEAAANMFACSNCGGKLTFLAQHNHLQCTRCGHIEVTETHADAALPLHDISDEAEQVLDVALITERAHRWAEAQHRVGCEHCGAITLLPPGQVTNECPYCGSTQIIDSAEAAELVDPQLIGLFRMDTNRAGKHIKRWLGKGFFAPDDLALLGRASNLRPVYFPFWTFDGTLEVKYRCEVSIGENRWEQRTGVQFMNFDDVLVPGLRALSFRELDRILPFEMKSLVEFKDEQLAGWHALTYDHSLADASLDARGRVMENANRKLAPRIEAAREKRNLQLIPTGWTGLTYKHLLLPLFVGNYHYKGVEYHLLVNGQTGKVGGVKPRDRIKVGMLLAGVGLIVLLLLFWLLWANRGFLFGV